LLDRFRAQYNTELPHQGIDNRTPAERYRPASRRAASLAEPRLLTSGKRTPATRRTRACAAVGHGATLAPRPVSSTTGSCAGFADLKLENASSVVAAVEFRREVEERCPRQENERVPDAA